MKYQFDIITQNEPKKKPKKRLEVASTLLPLLHGAIETLENELKLEIYNYYYGWWRENLTWMLNPMSYLVQVEEFITIASLWLV